MERSRLYLVPQLYQNTITLMETMPISLGMHIARTEHQRSSGYVFWFMFDVAVTNGFIWMKDSPNHRWLARKKKRKKKA